MDAIVNLYKKIFWRKFKCKYCDNADCVSDFSPCYTCIRGTKFNTRISNYTDINNSSHTLDKKAFDKMYTDEYVYNEVCSTIAEFDNAGFNPEDPDDSYLIEWANCLRVCKSALLERIQRNGVSK